MKDNQTGNSRLIIIIFMMFLGGCSTTGGTIGVSSGGKGGAVGVFKPKAKVLFYDNHELVLTKTYTTETRNKRYNWNTQKTIRKYHAEAFSEGMQEIQSQIVADLEKLKQQNQKQL